MTGSSADSTPFPWTVYTVFGALSSLSAKRGLGSESEVPHGSCLAPLLVPLFPPQGLSQLSG